MSVAVQREARPGIGVPLPSAAMVALAGAGLAMLAMRPLVAGSPDRPVLMGAGFAGLLALSLMFGPRRDPRSLPRTVVLAVGLAAMVAGAFVGGAAPPFPHAAGLLAFGAFGAVAEEAFFRQFVYGGLMRFGPAAAVLGSALLFALIHIPIYGLVVFPVDLGAGLVLSWQRWASGSWVTPAATHVVANLLAVMR
jgi:membrane protease YdiL (CAAX protease family)